MMSCCRADWTDALARPSGIEGPKSSLMGSSCHLFRFLRSLRSCSCRERRGLYARWHGGDEGARR